MNLEEKPYGFFKENHIDFLIVMVFFLVFSLLWFFYSYQMSKKPKQRKNWMKNHNKFIKTFPKIHKDFSKKFT